MLYLNHSEAEAVAPLPETVVPFLPADHAPQEHGPMTELQVAYRKIAKLEKKRDAARDRIAKLEKKRDAARDWIDEVRDLLKWRL